MVELAAIVGFEFQSISNKAFEFKICVAADPFGAYWVDTGPVDAGVAVADTVFFKLKL